MARSTLTMVVGAQSSAGTVTVACNVRYPAGVSVVLEGREDAVPILLECAVPPHVNDDDNLLQDRLCHLELGMWCPKRNDEVRSK